ncbi:MAG: hypothetical protein ABI273_08810 [Lacunisphaera sp.]
MKKLFVTQYERLAVGLAVMALVMSLGLSWSLRADLRRIKSVPVTVHLAKVADQAVALTAAVEVEAPWTIPPAQSAGSEWKYEVFTPPVVFYDRQAGRFSVTPAEASRRDDGEFAVQLRSVERKLFRVQLSGYAGTPGSYTAIFTRPGQSAPLLVRENALLEEVGLILKHFAIKKRAIEKTGGGQSFEIVAQAELQDERSGAITVLDSHSKKYDDALVAIVQLSDGPHSTREVREGDLISSGGHDYRISQIQADPAEMVVAREQAGLPAATKVLHLSEENSPAPSHISGNPLKSSFRPATGIVDNDQ